MLSRYRSSGRVRRLASQVAVGLLMLFVGLVVTRGPARRAVLAPVYLSRASGLAGQTSATNSQLVGDSSITGPFLTTAIPTSYDGDLRQLPKIKPVAKAVKPELEVNDAGQTNRAPVQDTAVQAPSGPSHPSQAMPRPLLSFPGLSFATAGSGWPPDTNGDVGPNHYIQVVNTSIGIFSKTGTLLLAQNLDTFFQSAPPPCNANNFGDPVVLYDAQNDRWIVTDFSWADINNGPHYECIAASKSGDPVSGGWRFYALKADATGPSLLNDYPKLGVWPDGIYMSANMFTCSGLDCSTNAFVGARAWAISPTQLYNGSVLTTVVFNAGSNVFGLLPSNLRGAAPPPGTPNYFVANDSDVTALDVFKFHVDWKTPASSTFTLTARVTEVPYNQPPEPNNNNQPAGIPQPSGGVLDSLGDRLMMQNQYRNISGTESLWLAHAANDPTGIRWYQVDVSGGTVPGTTVQQGTYLPVDGLYRWMPSLAVDKLGDMAVGYSTSSASQFPDIRYAGRVVSDTAGTLGRDEAQLISGGGSQTTACPNGIGGGNCNNRWGDYSAMTVDPVDDCTFWYTTEYYATSGQDWQTRIASFRFPVCGPVPLPLTPQAYLPALYINGSTSVGHWATLMKEGFEGAWPAAGWQVSDPGFGEYFWGKRNCQHGSGSYSAWAVGGGTLGNGLACGANYADNTNSWMVYGPFSLGDATAAGLQANLWLNTETQYDVACLMASIDGHQFYTSNAGTCFSGSSQGNFVPVSLDLNDVYQLGHLIGQQNVWIAFVFQSDFSNNNPSGAYVDDLLLQKCVAGICSGQPGAAAASALDQQVVTLTRP